MNEVKVDVKAQYIPDQSRPEVNQYVYAYTICITNKGLSPVQLISRHWLITDAADQTQEVQGLGVVGEQPIIQPSDSYTYTSGVVMETKSGMMTGSYILKAPAGDEFEVKIPPFALVQPNALH